MAGRSVTVTALASQLALLALTMPAARAAAPAASPGRILFASNRAENLNADLFAVGVDGYSRRNLTRTLFDHDYGARPSADGRRILFRRGFAGEAPIFVADQDGGNARQVGVGADPVWSPDGTRIAYVVRGEIFVMNADGSGVTRITTGMLPSWAPDGSRLAFLRPAESGIGFFVVDVGGAERRVASAFRYGGVVTDAPRWSPDGRRLVIQSGDVGGAANVTVADVETGDARQLTPGIHPRWSPDGSLIAFAAQSVSETPRIAVVRPDGTDLRSLTTESPNEDVSDDYPTWSPDGRRLVFFRTRVGLRQQAFVVGVGGNGLRRVTRESAHSSFFQYDEPVWLDEQTILFSSLLIDNDFDLYTMRPNGRDLRRLTSNDADERQAVWSPDGRRIAFARASLGRRQSIWVMDSAGRRARRLTHRSVEPAVSPTWSPDGRRLAFAGVYRHAAALYVVDARGKRLTRVRGPSAGGIEGVSVDWSPDGKRLVFGWEPGPPQIFVVPARGGRPRQLTRDEAVASFTPRWSPDGRTIAFVRATACGRNCDVYAVMTMTAAGTRRRQLVEHAFDPAWSPDGRKLVFSLNGRIAVAGRDGSNVTILSTPGPGLDGYPDWTGPTRRTVSHR